MYKWSILLLVVSIFSACSKKQELKNSVYKIGTITVVSSTSADNNLPTTLNDVLLEKIPDTDLTAHFNEINLVNTEEFLEKYQNQKIAIILITKEHKKQFEPILDNCLDINSEENFETNKIIIKDDVFAHNQKLILLFANTEKDITESLIKNKQQLLKMLLESENIVIQDEIKQHSDSTTNLSQGMKQEIGLSVKIPNQFELKIHDTDFFLFNTTLTDDNNKPWVYGFMVHSYPYTDSADFTKQAIILQRNNICKKQMKGELPGTYMTTSESNFYPATTLIKKIINNKEVWCLNGWWTVKGITLSGPFVRYIFPLKEKNRIIAMEGFVNPYKLNLNDKSIRYFNSIVQTVY